MSNDMPFIEGCYRLKGEPWQVVTAFKCERVLQVEVRDGLTWKSGVTGMNVIFPEAAVMNSSVLLELMSSYLGIDNWLEVTGPDSMALR